MPQKSGYEGPAHELDRDNARLQNEFAGVQQAYQSTLAKHRELDQQFHTQSAVCGELRTQLQITTATLAQAQAELAVLQNENPQLKVRLAELDDMSNTLRAENRSLIEEKARLEGRLAR